MTVQHPTGDYDFAYNGLGDRVTQGVNGSTIDYALDLNTGLTQVLSDGTNTYLYGLGRIGEEQPGGWQYHLGDALGSVRQLANPSATATLARSYEPFGGLLTTSGLAATALEFVGEQRDATDLTYLRARYYAPFTATFLNRDSRVGFAHQPASLHRWAYALNNPVNVMDPTGRGLPIESFPTWAVSSSVSTPSWARTPPLPAEILSALASEAWCPPSPTGLEEAVLDPLIAEIRSYGVEVGTAPKGSSQGDWAADEGTWTRQDLMVVLNTLWRVGTRMYSFATQEDQQGSVWFPVDHKQLFRLFFAGLKIERGPMCEGCSIWAWTYSSHDVIRLWGPKKIWTAERSSAIELVAHELGHVLDNRLDDSPASWVGDVLPGCGTEAPDDECGPAYGALGVQLRSKLNRFEVWADAFSSWAVDNFVASPAGDLWRTAVSSFLREIVLQVIGAPAGADSPSGQSVY